MSKKVSLTVAKSLFGLILSLQLSYSADSPNVNLFTEAFIQRGMMKIFEDTVKMDQEDLERELDRLEKLTDKFDSDLHDLFGPYRYHSTVFDPSTILSDLKDKCEKEVQNQYKISLKRDIMDKFKYWGVEKSVSLFSKNLETLKMVHYEDDFGTQAVLDEAVKELSLRRDQMISDMGSLQQ